MPSVLFVSKPITLPIHDGAQCLVRDVATHLTRFRPRVMGRKGCVPALAGVESVPIYPGQARFRPALADNIRAFAHLVTDNKSDLWHFVFAPNPRTSQALSKLRWLRRVRTVQTIASPPKQFEGVRELLFGDAVVAQSEWTKAQVLKHCPGLELSVIRPSVPELAEPSEEDISELLTQVGVSAQQPLVVYPGDLEFSGGAEAVAALVPQVVRRVPDCVFVYACRKKTERASLIEQRLKARLPREPVRFVGELPSLLPLLKAATVVLFPVDSLFGKVDIPVALLEAMRIGTPIVCFDHGPLGELAGTVQVRTGDQPDLLEALLAQLSSSTLRQAVSGRQMEFVRRQTPERAAHAYEQIYEQLCASR